MAILKEPLAELPQIVGTIGDERLERRLAHREVGPIVLHESLDLIEGTPVSEDHAELANEATDTLIRPRFDRGDETVPTLRFGSLPPALQALADAGEERELRGALPLPYHAEERVKGGGIFPDPAREAARNPALRLRPAGVLRDAHEGERIRLRQRTDSEPDEMREIVIGGIFVTGRKCHPERGALGKGQSLQGRGEG